MITILRKHHRWLMMIIAILSLPFVFYFVQQPDYGALLTRDALGSIYDRKVTLVEYSRTARLLTLASSLGLTLPNDLMITNVQTQNDMYAEFTWNRLVLRHEAEKLGIRPTANEIKEFVTTLSAFRGPEGFDIVKYNEFTKEALPSMGFNVAQIEEVVSDQLSLNKVRDLLGIGTQIPESETKESYEMAYGKLHVAVVRLRDENFKNEVRITDDEIAKYFESHKDQLKSEEKRKIEFVSLSLTDDEKALTGRERVEALQKVADKANDLAQALLEKDAKFAEVAARLEIPVVATEEFAAASPPPQFAGNPQLTQYSFQLSEKNPVSDTIQGTDGFHILHWLGSVEAKPLELAEAKPKIIEALTKERLQQLISTRGAEIAQQLRNALQAGTSLEAAISLSKLKLSPWWPRELVTSLGLNRAMEPSGLRLEQLQPFSLIDSSPSATDTQLEPKYETPDFQMIKNTVSALQPGQVSDFTPGSDGGFIAAIEKRDPADPAGFAEARTRFETGTLSQRRKAVFVEWMRDRRKAANAIMAPG